MCITYEQKQYQITDLNGALGQPAPSFSCNHEESQEKQSKGFKPVSLVRISDMKLVKGADIEEKYCVISYAKTQSGEFNIIQKAEITTNATQSIFDHKLHQIKESGFFGKTRLVTFDSLIQQICKDFNIQYIWFDSIRCSRLDNQFNNTATAGDNNSSDNDQISHHQINDIYKHAEYALVLVPELEHVTVNDDRRRSFDSDRFNIMKWLDSSNIRANIQVLPHTEWARNMLGDKIVYASKKILFVGRNVHLWSHATKSYLADTKEDHNSSYLTFLSDVCTKSIKSKAIATFLNNRQQYHENSTTIKSKYDEYYFALVSNISSANTSISSPSRDTFIFHDIGRLNYDNQLVKIYNDNNKQVQKPQIDMDQVVHDMSTRLHNLFKAQDLSILMFGRPVCVKHKPILANLLLTCPWDNSLPTWTGLHGAHLPLHSIKSGDILFNNYRLHDTYMHITSKYIQVRLVDPSEAIKKDTGPKEMGKSWYSVAKTKPPYPYDDPHEVWYYPEDPEDDSSDSPDYLSMVPMSLLDDDILNNLDIDSTFYGLQPTHFLPVIMHHFATLVNSLTVPAVMGGWLSIINIQDENDNLWYYNCFILMDVSYELGQDYRVMPVVVAQKKDRGQYKSVGVFIVPKYVTFNDSCYEKHEATKEFIIS